MNKEVIHSLGILISLLLFTSCFSSRLQKVANTENADTKDQQTTKTLTVLKTNETDSSRLRAVLKKINGFSEEEISATRYLEKECDLDNNSESKEYLLYINGNTFCGTGGCTLFVVNQIGAIYSTMTVTRTPIYMDVESNSKSHWSDLIVWSNRSFRRLVHNGVHYPSNPSTQAEVNQKEINGNPKRYVLLFE